MEKYSYDKNNGLWYELHGDYYLPCLVVSPEEKQTIGIWGRKRQKYLKERHPVLYSELVQCGGLNSHLAAIDEQARNQLALFIAQLAKAEGINEELKERDQMAWVGAMNSIRSRAEEVILNNLIYEEAAKV